MPILHLICLLCLVFGVWSHEKRLKTLIHRDTPQAPYFSVYNDASLSTDTGFPSASDLKGYDSLILAFLRCEGPDDQVLEWTRLNDSERSSIKAGYNKSILASAFGDQDQPTTNNVDPIAMANTMGNWVKEFNLDGIDLDYEDFNALNTMTPTAVNWIVSFTKQLRQKLPVGSYILTYAPIAPWFSPNVLNGVFLQIHEQVGDLIDWYNVQFYNQFGNYTNCDDLLNNSQYFPNSSLFQIAANGVPLSKLVIAKPASAQDGSGFMDPADLANCLEQAVQKGWNAGVTLWQYASDDYIDSVRSSAFPVPT